MPISFKAPAIKAQETCSPVESKTSNSLLEKFIETLDRGVDTFIGSSIKQLSSGRKQRIGIARSIYCDREIFIFDEATNALDKENEKNIIENIKKIKTKKTVIIISHRLENLNICDKIYMAKDGILNKQ